LNEAEPEAKPKGKTEIVEEVSIVYYT